MSDPDKIIVAHKRNRPPRRSFDQWEKAREWRDAVSGDYILSEVLHITADTPEIPLDREHHNAPKDDNDDLVFDA